MQREIVFTLTREDEQRARRVTNPGPYAAMTWAAIALAAMWGALAIIALRLSAPRMSISIYSFSCIMWIGLAIVYSSNRPRLIARRGAISVADDGITGTLDGKPINMSWKHMAGARNAADFIIIVPRRAARTLAIPKATLDDAEQLWQILEDRMIGKRGLIRSSTPRTFISNTAS